MTNASHEYAEMKDSDSTQLSSGVKGTASILWVESGTGTKWAVVNLDCMIPRAQQISCKVNDASGVAPTDANITVDNVAVISEPDAAAPSVTTIKNTKEFRLPDNHDLRAEYNDNTSEWECVWRAPMPLIVKALVNEASGVADTDATFDVDNTAVVQEGGAAVAATLTAQNTYGFELDNNAAVILVYDETNDQYIAIQGECPA
jgi:hypothetical protein